MPVPVGGRPQPVAFDGCVAAANAPQALPILGVGDRYLSTLGLPLLRGRAIDGSDRAGTEAAALLSESAARRCWPNLDAVGRRVRIGPRTREWATIVGVVKDPLASPALGAIMPEGLVIVSAAQRPDLPATLLVRGDGDLGPLVRQLRDAVRRVDPRQALVQVALVDELMSQRFVEGWLVVGLMDVFGALALALAAIGVFGVTSYSVAERTREFGIRIAMGAAPADILKLVTGRALALVGIGAALAAAGTAAVTRVMWAELLTLGASSRVGFGAIAGVIGLVALIACLLPARRATRVDPMVALRTE
jgi:putative ABC transport system permease protein